MRFTSIRRSAAAAVVAKPDEKWGETPCAFVELKAGASANAEELIDWCRERLARFKVPASRGVYRAAEDLDRQGPEVPAAGNGKSRLSAVADGPGMVNGVFQTHTPPDVNQRRFSGARCCKGTVAFRSVSRELRLQPDHFVFQFQLLSLQFGDLLVRGTGMREGVLQFALQSLMLCRELAQMRLK